MKQIKTIDENETILLAKKIANIIKEKNIKITILLNGELGAGKTKFVEGFLSSYRLDSQISSPTFNIVNVYSNDNDVIYHFDVYRISSYDELLAIGADQYLNNNICIIEWGNLIEDELKIPYLKIDITKDVDNINSRYFNISQNDKFKSDDISYIIENI